ncbi:hypothetical protein NOF55_21645 [Rhizobiaceae bacterium BDR2-2]|uniref:Uncharacterized protein n=1 Tax=Ectorhizobium quercum TaxID=2965071 RepID=A0AAE3SXF2_9HYPH|nr:hypothetical protein [Ectorhizobium quercum]MCX8999713.1 hypothetical protein [Ectorhizobium quercum]
MSLLINLTDASADLEAYIDSYVAATASLANRYGTFYPSSAPYDQWIQGTNTSDYAAVLDGDFTAYSGGNLTGTADALTFGYGLTTDASGLTSVTNVELTFDFRDLNVNAGPDSFDYLVYGLIAGDASRVYDYFDDAGTIQVGTEADNTLYGYDATDYFYFEDNWGSDTINDFTDGEDYIVFDTSLWTNYADFADDATISGNTIAWDGNTITLAGFSGTLSSADFQFVADPATIA